MFCPKCGKEIEEQWIRCPYCGNELKTEAAKEDEIILNYEENSDEKAENTTVEMANQNGSKSKGTIVAVLGVVAIVIAVIMIDKIRTANNPLGSDGEYGTRGTVAPDSLKINLEIDMLQYVGQPIENLLEKCPELSMDEDIEMYSDSSGQVIVMTESDKITYIQIQGGESGLSFGEVKINDHIEQVNTELLGNNGYSLVLEKSGQYLFGQIGSSAGVVFRTDDTGAITNIMWSETLQEEMDEYITEDSSGEVPDNGDANYEFLYGGILDSVIQEAMANGTPWEYFEYTLYDIDKDGYREMLIRSGASTMDTVYTIYSTDGNVSFFIGEIPGGDTLLYECPDANGFFADYCKMGYEAVWYYYMEDGRVSKELWYEGETEQYGYLNGSPIEQLQIPMTMYGLEGTSEAGETNDYILPFSDTRYLTREEVAQLSLEELRLVFIVQ